MEASQQGGFLATNVEGSCMIRHIYFEMDAIEDLSRGRALMTTFTISVTSEIWHGMTCAGNRYDISV